MKPAAFAATLPLIAITACKPPPTDADMGRDMPQAQPTFAADPLPSPDVTGAGWARSTQQDNRILYGIPGHPALLALECVEADSALPKLQITRMSAADKDAGALLALIGNDALGRIPIDAFETGGRRIWQGSADASALVWEPLIGEEDATATVPGGGMVELHASALPEQLIESCRNGSGATPPQSDLKAP